MMIFDNLSGKFTEIHPFCHVKNVTLQGTNKRSQIIDSVVPNGRGYVDSQEGNTIRTFEKSQMFGILLIPSHTHHYQQDPNPWSIATYDINILQNCQLSITLLSEETLDGFGQLPEDTFFFSCFGF